jgi:hypothetical protein
VLIRLYARMDVAILRPKFFTRILGLTAPPALVRGSDRGDGARGAEVRRPAHVA